MQSIEVNSPVSRPPAPKRHLAYLPLLIANVVLSVSLPPLLVHFLDLAVFDQVPLEILLGLIVFIALSMIEVLFYCKRLFEATSDLQRTRRIESQLDVSLHNIRETFRSLDLDDATGDVIFAYFSKKIEGLEHELEAVAGAKELRVDQEHLYLTGTVLAIFEGNRDDRISAVHRLKHNPQLLDAHELQWLRKVHELVKAGKIKGIDRLMLYSAPTDLESDSSIRIISAHHNSRAYDYRVLDERTFERLLVEYGVDKNTVDFAIYGKKILFRVMAYGSDCVTQGVYAKDIDQIKQYATIYQMCWNQGRKLDHAKIKKGITMDTLLSEDEAKRV